MQSCPECGSALSKDDKLCPNCGAEVVAAEEKPELVENLSFDQIIIDERGFTFRIRNTGTAPLTVASVLFYEQPTEIVNVSSEKGTVKDGLLTLQPGDLGDVTFQPSYTGVGGVVYPAAVITESGKRYETSVGYP
ncbi:MAG: zinc ribbon domain-containing protein [Conexivisphaerales archaeon]|jgi:ribosomal protein S27AE